MFLLLSQLFMLSAHAASGTRTVKVMVVDSDVEDLIGGSVQVVGR